MHISGSGKTSMISILLSEIIQEKEFTTNEAKKWILQIDAKLYQTDFSVLFDEISVFASRNVEKFITDVKVEYHIVVVDNIHIIPPTLQQGTCLYDVMVGKYCHIHVYI